MSALKEQTDATLMLAVATLPAATLVPATLDSPAMEFTAMASHIVYNSNNETKFTFDAINMFQMSMSVSYQQTDVMQMPGVPTLWVPISAPATQAFRAMDSHVQVKRS